MSDTLADILKQCGDGNAPGLKQKIYIEKQSNIEAIPATDADSHIISGVITMKDTNTFHVFDISKYEQEFKVTTEGDEDSNTKKAELKFFISKIDAVKSRILDTNSNGCPLIVIPTDKNGQRRLMGDLEDGAYMKIEETATPKNGYNVTITSEANHVPYFLTGAIPT